MPATSSRSAWAKTSGYHRIRDERVAERIVASSGLAPPGLVFEFGGGDGQLTAALARRSRRVVCIETDRELWGRLKARFCNTPNVEVVLADFMAYSLPARGDYGLISNLPFGLTASVMRRLQAAPNPPVRAALVLQLEAAHKWAGLGHETVASVRLKVRFSVEPLLALHRSAFAPRPNVDCMLVGLRRRPRPLVPASAFQAFEAFVRRQFGSGQVSGRASAGSRPASARPSELTVEEWVQLFRTKGR